jgi:hypothetical protein
VSTPTQPYKGIYELNMKLNCGFMVDMSQISIPIDDMTNSC